MFNRSKPRDTVRSLLERHFEPVEVQTLITAGRSFPVTTRVDLQNALERQFAERYAATPVGVHSEYSHETLSMAQIVSAMHHEPMVGPLQHDEIDRGVTMPARCLKRAIWMARSSGTPFAVVLSPAEQFGQTHGVHVEIAVPRGHEGAALSRMFLDELEAMVRQTGSYRGKVLSLEAGSNYSGRAGSVKVHRLSPVTRDQIIPPEKTLNLLERNVHGFMRQRERLSCLGLAVKKGLPFYGPPGTGKTHTIHYLASQLADHTTLLITAEQVGLLDE